MKNLLNQIKFRILWIQRIKHIQGWKILEISTRPTSTYVLVNSIIYIGNSQSFYSSCSMRHSPWRANEWIFPALHDINVILSCLFLAALWSPTGKGWPLGSLVCDVFLCLFVPYGVLGQVWYLIVSIPDLCLLPNFQSSFSVIWYNLAFILLYHWNY